MFDLATIDCDNDFEVKVASCGHREDPRIEHDARAIAEAISLLRDTAMPMTIAEVHRLAERNFTTFNALNCARTYLGTIQWYRDPDTLAW